jgi:hypothetical protein
MAIFHWATITPAKAGTHRELGADASVFRNDRFDLTLFRRPVSGPRPPIGLTATWNGNTQGVVLTEVRDR